MILHHPNNDEVQLLKSYARICWWMLPAEIRDTWDHREFIKEIAVVLGHKDWYFTEEQYNEITTFVTGEIWGGLL